MATELDYLVSLFELTVFPTCTLASVSRVVPIFLPVFARSSIKLSLWGMVAGEAILVTLMIYLEVCGQLVNLVVLSCLTSGPRRNWRRELCSV